MVFVPIKDIIDRGFCLIGIFSFPMFSSAKAVKGGLLSRVALLIPFSFTIDLAQFTHDTLNNKH